MAPSSPLSKVPFYTGTYIHTSILNFTLQPTWGAAYTLCTGYKSSNCILATTLFRIIDQWMSYQYCFYFSNRFMGKTQSFRD